MVKVIGMLFFVAALTQSSPISLAGDAAKDKSRIVAEGVVAAPVEKVWQAFTTKKGIEAWMVPHAEIELKVGGLMRTHYNPKGVLGDEGTIENAILSFDPERMLSIKIGKTPKGFPFMNAYKSTWTVLYFEQFDADQTKVQVVMQGYGGDEESQKMREFFAKGNAFTLNKLKEHFEKKSQR